MGRVREILETIVTGGRSVKESGIVELTGKDGDVGCSVTETVLLCISRGRRGVMLSGG